MSGLFRTAALSLPDTPPAPARVGRAGVVIGLSATQAVPYAGRGIGRYAGAYASALCSLASDRVVGLDIADEPNPSSSLRAHGRPIMPLTDLAHRPPSSGRLVYHVLAAFVQDAPPGALPPLWQIWPRWARSRDVALAVTLYDLIPLRFPERYIPPGARLWYMTRLELLRRADAVLAISHAAAEEGIELGGLDPRRVHVVGAGSPLSPPGSHDLERARRAARLEVPGTSAPVVCVTSDDPRKNTLRVIEAYVSLPAGLRRQHPLVLVGSLSPMTVDRIRAIARRHGAERDLVVAGEISDAALVGLYDACAVTVSASEAEGFGLPVLEGLQLGAVVISSDIPPARELVRDSAARFDPGSTDALRTTLERALADQGFREHLRSAATKWAAPFSWDRVVDRSVAAYDAAVARRSSRVRASSPRRPRLAVVVPASPANGERLVEAFAQRAGIDVYVTGRDPQPRGGWHPARRFAWRRELATELVLPLFWIGNSSSCADVWELLAAHRGDVLLLDARLDDLYAELARRGAIDRDRLADLEHAGFTGADVLDRARRVYVHGELLRRLLVRERPDRARDVRVVPLGLAEDATAVEQAVDSLIRVAASA